MYQFNPVTKTTIQYLTGRPLTDIEQIGAKQLFIVSYPRYRLLYSYKTIIGINLLSGDNMGWKITLKKYSLTTTKQISQFPYPNKRIEQSLLEQMINEARTM
jgi:hypothetical protein